MNDIAKIKKISSKVRKFCEKLTKHEISNRFDFSNDLTLSCMCAVASCLL